MSTIPYRRVRYLRPYLWPFPLWKYGPRSSWLTGEDLGEGWYVERFGAQEISRAEALAASRNRPNPPKEA